MITSDALVVLASGARHGRFRIRWQAQLRTAGIEASRQARDKFHPFYRALDQQGAFGVFETDDDVRHHGFRRVMPVVLEDAVRRHRLEPIVHVWHRGVSGTSYGTQVARCRDMRGHGPRRLQRPIALAFTMFSFHTPLVRRNAPARFGPGLALPKVDRTTAVAHRNEYLCSVSFGFVSASRIERCDVAASTSEVLEIQRDGTGSALLGDPTAPTRARGERYVCALDTSRYRFHRETRRQMGRSSRPFRIDRVTRISAIVSTIFETYLQRQATRTSSTYASD